MHKAAAPKIKIPQAPAVKPKRTELPSSFQPSPQMPWAGQRGTLEDLSSFGVSPEEFFGGGGRLMFSDTAPKTINVPASTVTPKISLPPKQGALQKQSSEKTALSVVEPDPKGFSGRATSAIANTAGRVFGLPAAAIVGQEKILDHLKTYDKAPLEKEIAHLKDDPSLKNTLIRIGHGDIGEDYRRLYSDPTKSSIEKAIGSVYIPYKNINSALLRKNHYSPLTDTVQIYGHLPEQLHHELGHAKDFNKRGDQERATLMSHAMLLEKALSMTHGINGLPFTQRLETVANENAEQTYKGDIKELRRRLWPGRGTYWAALAGGLAMLHPSVREKLTDFVSTKENAIGNDDSFNEKLQKILSKLVRSSSVGLGIAGAGALGGRLFAETRNLFDDNKGSKIKKASMNTEHGYVKGFIKRAHDYGFNRNEAIQLLKQALGEMPMASKKKVTPPVKIPPGIKGNANDVANIPKGPVKPLPPEEQF